MSEEEVMYWVCPECGSNNTHVEDRIVSMDPNADQPVNEEHWICLEHECDGNWDVDWRSGQPVIEE